MQQVFVDASAVTEDGLIQIRGSDAHHLGHVLRMRPGERIRVAASDDRYYIARLESFSPEEVTARIEEEAAATELSCEITLYVGIPKGDRMETIIEKVTELGVSKIVPVMMQHTVVRLEEKKKESRRARWQAIAENAARQSKRSRIPEVAPVCSFAQALEDAKTLELGLMPYEGAAGTEGTKEALRKLPACASAGIFIGPEGGFSYEEAAAAAGQLQVISLGRRILRTDTAAIAAVALCAMACEMASPER